MHIALKPRTRRCAPRLGAAGALALLAACSPGTSGVMIPGTAQHNAGRTPTRAAKVFIFRLVPKRDLCSEFQGARHLNVN